MQSKWSPVLLEDLYRLHKVFLVERNIENLGQLALPLVMFVVVRLHRHQHLIAQQHVPFLILLEWLRPYISFVSIVVVQMDHLQYLVFLGFGLAQDMNQGLELLVASLFWPLDRSLVVVLIVEL